MNSEEGKKNHIHVLGLYMGGQVGYITIHGISLALIISFLRESLSKIV